jgi:hypothetical protein
VSRSRSERAIRLVPDREVFAKIQAGIDGI